MKATKSLIAAACTIFLSTAAFAQTTPAGTSTGTGTMSGGMNTPQQGTGTMQSGTMQSGTMQNGTMQRGTNMNNGSTNGNMDRKTKMNGQKGKKKDKMSTSSGSTGTM